MPIPWLTKMLRKRGLRYTGRDMLTSVVRWYSNIKSRDTYKRVKKYIVGKKLLDVGVGAGGFFKYLQKRGFDVSGIDVSNHTVFEDTPVIIYDGKNFPFEDKTFDTALIIHVLHHCEDGPRVLEEAKRVSKRVIVIEDTYRNDIERTVVSMSDQLTNWEFYEHPYHTANWWKDYIKSKKWKLVHMESFSTPTYSSLYARYLLFVIE